jgi:hypothetical protein
MAACSIIFCLVYSALETAICATYKTHQNVTAIVLSVSIITIAIFTEITTIDKSCYG